MKLWTIPLITFAIGIGFFVYSLSLHAHKDQKEANLHKVSPTASTGTETMNRMSNQELKKMTFADLGTGISIASATILLFLTLTRTNTFADLKRMRTMDKKGVLISSNIAWLMFIPGTFWYYAFRASRGDFPPFGDSIGIPIIAGTLFFLFMLIPLNIFIVLTIRKANLPSQLFLRTGNYSKAKKMCEIFFICCLIINILCLIAFVMDGNHIFIPLTLFFTYILLTIRAGKIGKKLAET